MQLTQTRALLPRVIWLDSTPSTNTALREFMRLDENLPHGTLVVTDNQTAGKGRQGRNWQTPARTALAASILVRGFGTQGLGLGWLPLLAGSAVCAALQPYFTGETATGRPRIGVKWPNDVHVSAAASDTQLGPKLSGVLCELQTDGSIIVGMGINVLIPKEQLPTHRAGSVLSSGANVQGARTFDDERGAALADSILKNTAAQLLELVALAATEPAGARQRVREDSLTLTQTVTVHLPSGEKIEGRASSLAEDGSLVLTRAGGAPVTVSAGDVEHVR